MLVYPDGSTSGTIGGGSFEKMVTDDCLQLLESGERHQMKRYAFSQMGKDATGMSCGGEGEVFMEVSARPKRLYIFGGGHICRDIVKLAAGSDFSICVIDDRPDILDGFRSPVATLTTDAAYEENFPSLDRDSFVVIVTRSHKYDEPVLAQAIGEDCAYIGMIGSKAKIRKMYAALEKTGVDPSRLEQVHAPIGLNMSLSWPN
jgi:xanthine dehydrogenase accessory factor